ncbi:MAG: pyruvate dehydrogenase (acetyl-transferring) E1 component subunit alpha, partial [Kordiimonadaceae bacterium]|nr:pyruvate dehydrogenase (acetyl-transferring) E1 component subunit alpha [Kordiimonadaceae bacterium]
KYRSKEEVSKMRAESDPIDQVKNRILNEKILSEADLKAIDKEIKATVSEAAEFAQNSPEPDLSELYTDVLVAE